MRALIFILLGICAGSLLQAQEKEALSFGLLSQYNDLSLLREKEDRTAYEKLKYIDLNNRNYLSFGGSYRFQTESFINQEFLHDGAQDNIWYLNRLMFYAHLNLDDKFELFAELNSSTIIGKDNISPVDKDVLAFNQLFVKYNFDRHWSILLGRENMNFGSRRLIDLREGTNVRRSFDLARVTYKKDNFVINGFFGVPVRPKDGVFDNDFLNFDETFTGVYLTKNIKSSFNFDAYGFYQKDAGVTYNAQTADENRYTIGSRFFGNLGDFSHNNELAYQFGKFGEDRISAWTLSLNGVLKLNLLGDTSNFGFKTELISGDKDPEDSRQDTFDALYPRGAYFGRVARFGPSNLFDMHPYFNVSAGKFFFELDYDAFWRYSTHDVVYDAALMPAYPDVNDAAFIANQVGTFIGYELNNHLGFELETSIVFPGAFLKESGLSDTLYHFVFTASFVF